MRAGELRHFIEIHEPTSGRDPVTGATVPGFALLLADVPAKFAFLSGKEKMSAEQARSAVVARVTIRAGVDVPTDGRIVYRGANYEIDAIHPDPNFNEYLTLFVTEGVTR